MLNADDARAVWTYNPETGDLIWNVKPSIGTKEGSVAGTLTAAGYRRVRYRRKHYLAHRLVWLHVVGEWPQDEIDHIDRNKLNNRIENLRVVGRKHNQQNQRAARKDNSLGTRGVCVKRGRYVAQISIDGKVTHLGYYQSAEEAQAAYNKARAKHHAGYMEKT